MAWEGLFGGDLGDFLVKVGVFLVVQALVYLILSKSSNVFSPARMGSFGLRTVRSASLRRILAALSDLPAGGESSPPGSSLSRSLSRESSSSDAKEDAARS